MTMLWMWLAVAAYFAVNLAISLWASRRIKSEKDFLLAGRDLGFVLVSVSLFATWFGSETVMGSSAAVSQEGLAGGRADPFGYALCLAGMGLFLAYRMRERNYVTLGDFFKDRYSRNTEIVGSALFVPSVIVWASAQIMALAQLMFVLTGLNYEWALAFAALLGIVYTWFGGLLGSVLTNALQSVLIIVGLMALLVTVVAHFGGIGEALSRIEVSQLTLVGEGESLLSRIDLWSIPILGSLISQAAFGRILAARSPEVARNACFGAFGIYLAIGLIPVFIALLAPHMGITLAEGDSFLPELAKSQLGPIGFILFLSALLSVVLSTITGTLLTVAALISHNLILPARPNTTEREKVLLTRILVAVSGVTAYLFSLGGDSILDTVIFADSLGTPGLLVVVLIGLYMPKFGGPIAAFSAFGVGLGGYLIANFGLAFEASFLFAVVSALLAYVAIAIFEKRMMSAPV